MDLKPTRQRVQATARIPRERFAKHTNTPSVLETLQILTNQPSQPAAVAVESTPSSDFPELNQPGWLRRRPRMIFGAAVVVVLGLSSMAIAMDGSHQPTSTLDTKNISVRTIDQDPKTDSTTNTSTSAQTGDTATGSGHYHNKS